MVSEFITRTARLVPYAKRPKQVPSFVTAYSYEPLPDDPGSALGSIFAVIEVLISGRSSEEVADLLIETLGHHYYNIDYNTNDAAGRFESAIKAVNRELASYVNQGNAAWIGKLSAVIAVQVGTELHVAQTGSAEAFLYRGRGSARITNRQPSNRPVAPTKTFGSIASGQLEAGDRILLATPALIHQLSLQQLRDVIANNTPNNSISELTELLRSGSGERIAALVIEATTPELAALQVRSEQPNEIQIGLPETHLEAAKLAAAPLAQATITSGKHLNDILMQTWRRSRPIITRSGLAIAGFLRRQLSSRSGQWRLGIGLMLILVLGLGYWYWQGSVAATNRLFNRYQATYQQYLVAQEAIKVGDSDGAKTILSGLQGELSDLSKGNGRQQLNNKLRHSALPESEPKTIEELSKLIAIRIDELEGLTRVNATSVVGFTSIKYAKPSHIEILNGKAYLIDGSNNAIHVVDITTNSVKTNKATTGRLGRVLATTLSSAGDGLYLLTDQPGVWFYRFDSGSLVEQTLTFGQWPAATAIGSYAGNLYLLGQDTIYKHTRTQGGFSPKTDYLTTRTATGLKGAAALAVDGAVYVTSSAGLQQYLAGVLQQTAIIPSGLGQPTSLRSTDNGNTIIASSADGQRIGLWDARQGLVLKHQYIINGIKSLTDATYDPKTKAIYALVNDRLVRFNP